MSSPGSSPALHKRVLSLRKPSADSSDVSPVTRSQTTRVAVCPLCGGNVPLKDSTACKQCNKPYHHDCCVGMKVLPNGGFIQCCGKKPSAKNMINNSPKNSSNCSPTKSPDNVAKKALAISKSDRKLLVEDITNSVCARLSTAITLQDRDSLVNDITNAVCSKMKTEIKDPVKSVFSDVFNELKNELRAELSSEINEVRQEINEVRKTQAECNTHLDSLDNGASVAASVSSEVDNKLASISTDVTNDCLSEMEDRIRRKKNVMVFGVPETDGGDSLSRKTKDGESIALLFKELSFSDNLEHVDWRRVGKYTKNLGRFRPINIMFPTMNEASLLLKIFSQKRGTLTIFKDPKQKPLLILPDQTVMQQRAYDKLKLELAERRSLEKDKKLKIIYVKGVPKIVAISPRMTHQDQ